MASAEYLVAMCDVLGFTHLVATTALDEIHARYLALVEALEPRPFYRITPGTYAREIVLNCRVFSDTILYWAPAGDAMELLPFVLGQIMAQAMSTMPLRAGLAFGNCIIDPAREIYIGQPIIDAYHTEREQEWVGGAFHPSCWKRRGLLDVLCKGRERSAVKYPVPVKAGASAGGGRLEYALNWPVLAGQDFSMDVLTASEGRAPQAAKEKWRHARRFYEACRGR